MPQRPSFHSAGLSIPSINEVMPQSQVSAAPIGSGSNLEAQQLHILNTWLDKNPHINACPDQENLLFFLRSTKYDLEGAKKKITRFYQMRAERFEWFKNRDPFLAEIQELLSLGVFLPIEGADNEGRQVVVVRTAVHNPKYHSQNNVLKVSMMILDLLLQFRPEPCAQGIVAIFDMAGVRLGHALQMTPKLIKRAVESWQTYPCQPKRLEFVHSPPHVNVVLNTFRLFMKAKMRSRVYVTQDCAVQCSNLPKELGGQGQTYAELTLKWKILVEENATFYEIYDKYKSVLK